MGEPAKRLVTRVMMHDLLQAAGEMCDRYGTDLIDTMVFTAVWNANTAHLTDSFTGIFQLPPDSERRPVPLATLARTLRLDAALVAERLAGLMEVSLIEKTKTGYVAPTVVFTQARMLDIVELTHARALRLIEELDRCGVVDEARGVSA